MAFPGGSGAIPAAPLDRGATGLVGAREVVLEHSEGDEADEALSSGNRPVRIDQELNGNSDEHTANYECEDELRGYVREESID